MTAPLTDPPLLRVEHLSVRLAGPAGTTPVLDDVSLAVRSGRTTGVIGESGSGKSMLAMAIIGLLPDGSSTSGQILLHEENLLGADTRRRRQVRGREISMIFQDPLSALNPSQRIGRQVGEILRRNGSGRAAAARTAVDLMTQVGIPDPAVRAHDYPHQFSGGMRQRAMIALAVAGDPALVLADEPTTALDVTVQARILRLLRTLQDERQMSMLMVSHDLRVMSHVVARPRGALRRPGLRTRADPAGAAVAAAPVHEGPRGQRARGADEVGAVDAAARSTREPTGPAVRVPVPSPLCDGPPALRHRRPALREIAPDRWTACHYAEELAP